ncbi:UDP-N-acetyl-D-mannosamine dehydrogenase [Glutamicibacter sp.]|jgi:nucleotide sugar dehydrogenase|uniref:UDP-N-acetyl-D-mannosamine dehydrogenase n=1 Tax=Glutamicibacter sp. TaxID=1931995 RepID=UPI002B49ED5A|nr:UDP-N-acetyl-D-mannosamine dehydrogenase [Glutamicibacter sp.]HJX77001.1 UDP-N-acetyl-D-mannosamine dehydrogenase [Glutamicibacter sp.]
MTEIDVCVVGMGYIGLPTSVVLARAGWRVHGVDINEQVVNDLSNGVATFEEPGISSELRTCVNSGNLTVSTVPQVSNVYIIAVPTPINSNNEPDTSYIRSAIESVAPFAKDNDLFILESTSPVGTTEMIRELLLRSRPDLVDSNLYFAHCPERVIPGSMMKEIISNDRVVGGYDAISAERAANLYRSFCQGEIHLTDARTAELTKLTENSFRDVNIAFANELSIVADHLGVNVWEVIELANKHPRVQILQPGPGVGGHCIAVDPWFLVASAPTKATLIRSARNVNDSKPKFVVDKIAEHLRSTQRDSLALLGLAFKANVDDLRESPAVSIVQDLALQYPDVRLSVVEPFVDVLPRALQEFDNVKLTDLETALENENLLVLLVDHDIFKTIPQSTLLAKDLVDTRGLWKELDI